MFDQIYNLSFWNDIYWGNAIGDYAVAFGAFIVFLIGLKFIQIGVLGYLRRLSKKTKTDIDDTLIEIIGSIRPPFYSFLAFYLAIIFIALSGVVQSAINTLLLIWIVYQIILAIQILIDYVVRKKFISDEDDEGSKGITNFISGLLKAGLWAIGLLAILSNLGVNVNSLIAGLGIGGLAIAFALQNILGDLFSSFAIHMDKPFRVGDFIAVGDYKGTVEKIGIKTTRIRSTMSEEIIISNTELTSARVQNYGKMKERRNVFTLGITYETPVEKIKKVPHIVKEAIESTNSTRFDRTHFSSFGDSALNFDVSYYAESGEYSKFMDIKQEINLKIMESFAKEGIEFAYPTQTLYMAKS